MDKDKKIHLIGGLLIAFSMSCLFLILDYYDQVIQIGDLGVPVYFVPLMAVMVIGYLRERFNKSGFDLADLIATIIGGMIGCAMPYSYWYYALQS